MPGSGSQRLRHIEEVKHLCCKRFGKRRPDVVQTIEERARREEEKKAAKREAKRLHANTERGS